MNTYRFGVNVMTTFFVGTNHGLQQQRQDMVIFEQAEQPSAG
jgi:hypothetical protein